MSSLEGPNPGGLCQCGCGQKTRIATKTNARLDHVCGLPIRYICGHSGGNEASTDPGPNASGLCMCGCGQETHLAGHTYQREGLVKGRPVRFVPGHHFRKSAVQIVVEPATGCHLWQGSKDGHGYGQMRANGKVVKAYKYFYEQKYGPVPDGKELDHFKCDNPACCNADHVRPVTHVENVRRGSAAKLTLALAREIRALAARPAGLAPIDIAAIYAISRPTVYGIIHGRRWVDSGEAAA